MDKVQKTGFTKHSVQPSETFKVELLFKHLTALVLPRCTIKVDSPHNIRHCLVKPISTVGALFSSTAHHSTSTDFIKNVLSSMAPAGPFLSPCTSAFNKVISFVPLRARKVQRIPSRIWLDRIMVRHEKRKSQ